MRNADIDEAIILTCVLAVTGIVHGINMFGAPHYAFDEGLFMVRAWSFVTHGQLSPDPFTYDQTPLGWMQIGWWAQLTGGFHTFGIALDSGRAFMLVVQLLSTLCIYAIVRAVSRNRTIAVLACLLFALSPLAIYFHRRVYLDNIAALWVLVSLWLLLHRRSTSLWLTVLSGTAMGISILSKMPAIAILPAVACLVVVRAPGSRRLPYVLGWLVTVGGVLALWVLYAAARGDLFPGPPLPGAAGPHHTLIGGLRWQLGRERDGGLLDPASAFWRVTRNWYGRDPILLVGGTVGSLLCIANVKRQPICATLGLGTFCFWGLYARGGVVQPYYIALVLPLLAINLALMCDLVAVSLATGNEPRPGLWGWLRDHDLRAPLALISAMVALIASHGRRPDLALSYRVIAVALHAYARFRESVWLWLLQWNLRMYIAACTLIALFVFGYLRPAFALKHDPLGLWRDPQTLTQRQSLAWVLDHVSPHSIITIENYGWADLLDGSYHGRVWNRAIPYLQVDNNSIARRKILRDDWRSIDYVMAGPLVKRFAYRPETGKRPRSLRLLAQAMEHGTVVARFDTPPYPIEIFRVDHGDGSTVSDDENNQKGDS